MPFVAEDHEVARAIQPYIPICQAVSERVSALSAAINPCPGDRFRIHQVLGTGLALGGFVRHQAFEAVALRGLVHDGPRIGQHLAAVLDGDIVRGRRAGQHDHQGFHFADGTQDGPARGDVLKLKSAVRLVQQDGYQGAGVHHQISGAIHVRHSR